MASEIVTELQAKAEAAWANVSRQVQGMDRHLEASTGPGEWTAREILCHLLFKPGFTPSGLLKTFADRDLPVIDISSSDTFVTPERQKMSLQDLLGALDAQRQDLVDYLGGLSEADLARKARIPLFMQFMGTDEVPIPMFVGAMFDFHWTDHSGQLAEIRKAVGLPDAS